MTKPSMYKPPPLDGHVVPYRGKRYWVIEVDEDHPFEWVSDDVAQWAIFDKLMGYVIATIYFHEDDRLWVYMATQVDSGYAVDSLPDAVRVAASTQSALDRDGIG